MPTTNLYLWDVYYIINYTTTGLIYLNYILLILF